MAKKKEAGVSKDVFNLSVASSLEQGKKTGERYFDNFIEHRSSLVSQIVYMDINDYFDHAYSKQDLKNQKVIDKDLILAELNPRIIDIINNRGVGCGRAVVAKEQGIKVIPVLILANKPGQIEWWIERTGVKVKD